jgi:hypothetical protein
MSQMTALTPALSPRFARAKKLSRFVALLFTLSFLVMLSVDLSAVMFVFFPKTPSGVSFGIGLPGGFGVGFGDLHTWQSVGAMVAVQLMTVPTVLVLYHMWRLFLCFAKGEIFAAPPIAHLRAAGFWQTTSFFTCIGAVYLLALCGIRSGLLSHVHFPGPILGALLQLPTVAVRFWTGLFIGIPIIIAAYVMEEARRIAADNAEIV